SREIAEHSGGNRRPVRCPVNSGTSLAPEKISSLSRRTLRTAARASAVLNGVSTASQSASRAHSPASLRHLEPDDGVPDRAYAHLQAIFDDRAALIFIVDEPAHRREM